MKLHEITQQEIEDKFPEDSYAVKWLNAHRITDMGISNDGSIIFYKGPSLRGIEEKKLPFKIHSVNFGTLDVAESKLETMEGFPEDCGGSINIMKCEGIKSFDYISRRISGNLYMKGCGITSFEGIADHIDELTELTADWGRIKSGGLGLILIKHLHEFRVLTTSGAEPFKIIEKYLGKPDALFDCQQELIDAGFEEHAKL